MHRCCLPRHTCWRRSLPELAPTQCPAWWLLVLCTPTASSLAWFAAACVEASGKHDHSTCKKGNSSQIQRLSCRHLHRIPRPEPRCPSRPRCRCMELSSAVSTNAASFGGCSWVVSAPACGTTNCCKCKTTDSLQTKHPRCRHLQTNLHQSLPQLSPTQSASMRSAPPGLPTSSSSSNGPQWLSWQSCYTMGTAFRFGKLNSKPLLATLALLLFCLCFVSCS